MDKKTTILLDTAGFLAAVHNYKKSEIADLIVALCEFNLYGCTSVKLTDMKKIHFDSIQEVIELRNSRWLKTCEINAQNAKKRTANRKATAERNSSEPPGPAQTDRPEDKERDKENDSELDEDKESDNDFINKKDRNKEQDFVDKSRYVGAPSVEEVAIYCKESGYSNNLEKIETIRSDGKVEAIDLGVASLSGSIAVRYGDNALMDKARAGVPVDLELGYQLSDTQRLVITCHEVYLPKPKRSISGPGGIECTYDFQGAKNTELGKMVTVQLYNDVEEY